MLAASNAHGSRCCRSKPHLAGPLLASLALPAHHRNPGLPQRLPLGQVNLSIVQWHRLAVIDEQMVQLRLPHSQAEIELSGS